MEPRGRDGRTIQKDKIRNILIDAICLVMVGEIISLLAGNTFSWDVTVATAIEVVLLAILAAMATRNPYTSVLSALVIFIIISILCAALKPSYLGGSIIIKIFILIYLVRAIPEARELQAALRHSSTGT